MSGKRGLVISYPVIANVREKTLEIQTPLNPNELRLALLFWDKLDLPQNNLIFFALDPDAQYLFDAGVLQRSIVRAENFSGDMAAGLVRLHTAAFRFLDKREPGVWSLSSGDNALSVLDHEIEGGRGVLVSLHRAIPVPDKDVPLDDILEFKAKHLSELGALRERLDAIYQRIISAGDGALALNSEIDALGRAIDDHLKASKASGMSFRAASINAGLNVSGAVSSGLTAALKFDLDLAQSATIAAVASLSIGVGFSLKGQAPSATPFRYVSSYHEKLF